METSKFKKHSSTIMNKKKRNLYIKSTSKSKNPVIYIKHQGEMITYKKFLKHNKNKLIGGYNDGLKKFIVQLYELNLNKDKLIPTYVTVEINYQDYYFFSSAMPVDRPNYQKDFYYEKKTEIDTFDLSGNKLLGIKVSNTKNTVAICPISKRPIHSLNLIELPHYDYYYDSNEKIDILDSVVFPFDIIYLYNKVYIQNIYDFIIDVSYDESIVPYKFTIHNKHGFKDKIKQYFFSYYSNIELYEINLNNTIELNYPVDKNDIEGYKSATSIYTGLLLKPHFKLECIKHPRYNEGLICPLSLDYILKGQGIFFKKNNSDYGYIFHLGALYEHIKIKGINIKNLFDLSHEDVDVVIIETYKEYVKTNIINKFTNRILALLETFKNEYIENNTKKIKENFIYNLSHFNIGEDIRYIVKKLSIKKFNTENADNFRNHITQSYLNILTKYYETIVENTEMLIKWYMDDSFNCKTFMDNLEKSLQLEKLINLDYMFSNDKYFRYIFASRIENIYDDHFIPDLKINQVSSSNYFVKNIQLCENIGVNFLYIKKKNIDTIQIHNENKISTQETLEKFLTFLMIYYIYNIYIYPVYKYLYIYDYIDIIHNKNKQSFMNDNNILLLQKYLMRLLNDYINNIIYNFNNLWNRSQKENSDIIEFVTPSISSMNPINTSHAIIEGTSSNRSLSRISSNRSQSRTSSNRSLREPQPDSFSTSPKMPSINPFSLSTILRTYSNMNSKLMNSFIHKTKEVSNLASMTPHRTQHRSENI
jgi:hypothetical protein